MARYSAKKQPQGAHRQAAWRRKRALTGLPVYPYHVSYTHFSLARATHNSALCDEARQTQSFPQRSTFSSLLLFFFKDDGKGKGVNDWLLAHGAMQSGRVVRKRGGEKKAAM